MFRTFMRSSLLFLSLTSPLYSSIHPPPLYVAISPLDPPLHLPSFAVGFKDKRKVVDPNARVCPKCHNGNSFPPPLGRTQLV
jgi:hypothetical protein